MATAARPDATAYGHVLSRLRKVTRHAWGWKALCPAHEDTNQSLSIKIGDTGNLLCKCHACGANIEQIAKALGLDIKEMFPAGERKQANGLKVPLKIIQTYDYTDEHGEVLYQAVRYEPKDFRQRKPDGNGGWVWTLGDVRRVLYRLPEVLAGHGRMTFVCEGEKDCDRLASLGFIATTNSGGAGKWKPNTPEGTSYAKSLQSRHVAIIPDDDTPGYDHARNVAETLRGVAATVRIVSLFPAGGNTKQDVSDWLDQGHTADDLRKLVSEMQPLGVVEPRKEPQQPAGANGCTGETAQSAKQHDPMRARMVQAAELIRQRADRLDPLDWLYFAHGAIRELETEIRQGAKA